MHIAQIGTGRVGRPTAYAIMCTDLADILTVCDKKHGLAKAFAEELRHVNASRQKDLQINWCESAEDVSGADIILISAGKPRTPGVMMSRRELATQNGAIIKQISESTAKHNPDAKYVVITNPVDAMAMVCKKYSNADFVISTGTNLETLRFHSRLATVLAVPVSWVNGWVGGEHGSDAIILWSTVKIKDQPLHQYLDLTDNLLSKNEIEAYVKSVSKDIVDNIGATEFGPAASFRDIIKDIIINSHELIPVAAPANFKDLPEPTFVSIPRKLGKTIGDSLFDALSNNEKTGIEKAAKSIYQTFKTAM